MFMKYRSADIGTTALIAQLGERQTEDLKAPCSIHGQSMSFLAFQAILDVGIATVEFLTLYETFSGVLYEYFLYWSNGFISAMMTRPHCLLPGCMPIVVRTTFMHACIMYRTNNRLV